MILAVARDISERKRAEEAIRLVNGKLNLLTGITRHDIGNQLTALFQYIDLSKMMVQDPGMKTTIEKEEAIAHNIRRQIDFTREYEEWEPQSLLAGRENLRGTGCPWAGPCREKS